MTLEAVPSGPARQDAPGDIDFVTPHGEPDTLAHYAGPLLVIQLVRYFGCLPCRQYLEELDGRAQELEALGARALAIGGSADYQARWLAERGVRMPLLLDPEQRFREWVGMGELSSRQLMSVAGMRSYASAVRNGYRLQKPTQDRKKSPGVVVLSEELELLWTHEGKAMGDYPPLGDLIATVTELATEQRDRARDEEIASRPDRGARPLEELTT